MTAPSAALPTRRAYLASAPVRSRVGRRLVGVHATGDLDVVERDVQATRVDVEGDLVPVADRGDRAATRRLGRDVAGHEAVGGAAEAPVREQRDLLAEPGAVDRGRDGEHLAHARPPGRAFVADDDDVPRLDAAVGRGRHRRLLALEHARRPAVPAALVAGELDHAALGGEVAAQDRQAARGLERIVERADDALAGRLARLGGVRPDRLARHGERVGVQDAGLAQAREQHGDATGLVEVDGDVAPAGLEIAQQRRALADAVEVVDRELDAGLAGDREQVQDAVRRAPARGHGGDRVLERLAGDDVARARPAAQHVDDEPTGLEGDLALRAVLRGNERAADGRDPENLEGHRHRVGGELPAAGAGARGSPRPPARGAPRRSCVPSHARRRPRRRPGSSRRGRRSARAGSSRRRA